MTKRRNLSFILFLAVFSWIFITIAAHGPEPWYFIEASSTSSRVKTTVRVRPNRICWTLSHDGPAGEFYSNCGSYNNFRDKGFASDVLLSPVAALGLTENVKNLLYGVVVLHVFSFWLFLGGCALAHAASVSVPVFICVQFFAQVIVCTILGIVVLASRSFSGDEWSRAMSNGRVPWTVSAGLSTWTMFVPLMLFVVLLAEHCICAAVNPPPPKRRTQTAVVRSPPRPNKVQPVGAAPPPHSSAPKEMWACSTCSFPNSPGSESCSMCTAPRSGAAPPAFQAATTQPQYPAATMQPHYPAAAMQPQYPAATMYPAATVHQPTAPRNPPVTTAPLYPQPTAAYNSDAAPVYRGYLT